MTIPPAALQPWHLEADLRAGASAADQNAGAETSQPIWNRAPDYFEQMTQGPVRHALTRGRRGRTGGAHNIGRTNAAKHLDEALRYILWHEGVWATTADDIAEYNLANYYDQVTSWITERKARVAE